MSLAIPMLFAFVFGVWFGFIVLVELVKSRDDSRDPPEMKRIERRGNEYEIELTDGRVYRGDSTVWHSYPSGDRASTSMEAWLRDRWKAYRWQEPKASR